MGHEPFDGLTPASATGHVRWATEAMQGNRGVALVVPGGFDTYLRIMHGTHDGSRWADVAPAYLRRATGRYEYPFPEALQAVEGDLGADVVDRLLRHLSAATSTADRCHYGMWQGWGQFHRGAHSTMYAIDARRGLFGSMRERLGRRRHARARDRREEAMYRFLAACAAQPWWGGRETWLFDGPIERVTAIGSPSVLGSGVDRQGPQWWWPDDRAWFLGNEIDLPWSYLAGSTALIEAVHADAGIESVRIDIDDEW